MEHPSTLLFYTHGSERRVSLAFLHPHAILSERLLRNRGDKKVVSKFYGCSTGKGRSEKAELLSLRAEKESLSHPTAGVIGQSFRRRWSVTWSSCQRRKRLAIGFSLSLFLWSQQAFRNQPRNVTVKAGGTAVLRCEVLRPTGVVQWVKDGFLLGPQRRQYHLRIEKVALEDDSPYECQVGQSESSRAIVSQVALITVLIPPSDPVIEAETAEPWIAGEEYTVTCTAPDSKPAAEVTLFRSIFTALSSDHGQQLLCRAINPALSHALEARLIMNVYFPPQAPVIEGLEREELKAGTILKLVCSSYGGNPLATLHWTKVKPEDNMAELCCESVNQVSPRPQSIYRTLRVLFEPAALKVLGSSDAVEGKEVTLCCYTSSSNPPVSREENGLPLICEAFNKGTRFSKIHTSTLQVFYPPQKVWMDAPPVGVPLRAGTTVRLVCYSTGGNPPGRLTWFKGKTACDNQRTVTSQKVVSRELVLVLQPSDNMAIYRCEATNQAKKVLSAQTMLRVQFPAISVKIVANQEEMRRGETVTLECISGSSNPKTNITWSLGAERVKGTDQAPKKAEFGEFGSDQPKLISTVEDDTALLPLTVSANPDEITCKWTYRGETLVKERDPRYHWREDMALEIWNVTRRDAGNYTATCQNAEGKNRATITLDVHYAPSVKAVRDPAYVDVGQTADLGCVADANPINPGVFSWEWLGEDDDSLPGSEGEDGPSGWLTIPEVSRSHSGRYRCTVDNGIAPPASAEWGKVASRGDGSSTANVVCQAEGVPKVDFSWAKNGVPMDFANPRYWEQTVREGSVHTSTVTVVNVSAALDYAVFTCTARNSLGEDLFHIQLLSTNHPDPPSDLKMVGISGTTVTLQWTAGFDGGLEQKFRVRYHWADSASSLYVDVFPPRDTTFTVSGLSPVTTYNFSVNAINAMGESEYADNNAVLTVTTRVVGGVLLALNALGCSLVLRWRGKRRSLTGHLDTDRVRLYSRSTVTELNRYEGGDLVNTAARRTLLVDSGSESESGIYESYGGASTHYYYPTVDFHPTLYPHPEGPEGRDRGYSMGLGAHIYEDVMDRGMYEDLGGVPLPPSYDLRYPSQTVSKHLHLKRDEGTYQGPKVGINLDQPIRVYDTVSRRRPPGRDLELPFELMGELRWDSGVNDLHTLNFSSRRTCGKQPLLRFIKSLLPDRTSCTHTNTLAHTHTHKAMPKAAHKHIYPHTLNQTYNSMYKAVENTCKYTNRSTKQTLSQTHTHKQTYTNVCC
ncbi:hypothetical protein JZ751_018490 [Albula glossodonta]|uniref:Nephrin n=1 Tax=Albula glossodonta TaxID=121402 RepID=A0A8T2NWA9_9TELE|nr:hypothetical protein JZ751_018490 [Albula glossodonta]